MKKIVFLILFSVFMLVESSALAPIFLFVPASPEGVDYGIADDGLILPKSKTMFGIMGAASLGVESGLYTYPLLSYYTAGGLVLKTGLSDKSEFRFAASGYLTGTVYISLQFDFGYKHLIHKAKKSSTSLKLNFGGDVGAHPMFVFFAFSNPNSLSYAFTTNHILKLSFPTTFISKSVNITVNPSIQESFGLSSYWFGPRTSFGFETVFSFWDKKQRINFNISLNTSFDVQYPVYVYYLRGIENYPNVSGRVGMAFSFLFSTNKSDWDNKKK